MAAMTAKAARNLLVNCLQDAVIPVSVHQRERPERAEGPTPMGLSRCMARLALRPTDGLTTLIGLLAVALFLALPGDAYAQGAVRSVHGDWQIRAIPRRAPRPSNAP